MDRHDHAAAPLGRGHHPGLELPPRAPRPVRGERHRTARPGARGPRRAAPGRRPGSWSPRTARYPSSSGEIRQVLAVAILAHHDGDALPAVVPQQREQRLVPQQEHVGPPRLVEGAPAVLVLRSHPPGAGQQPHGRRGDRPRAAAGGTLSFTCRAARRRVPPPASSRPARPAGGAPARTLRAERRSAGSRGSSSGRSASARAAASARSWSSSGTTSRSATRFTRLTHSTVRTRWNTR